jgi:hypothetical protein
VRRIALHSDDQILAIGTFTVGALMLLMPRYTTRNTEAAIVALGQQIGEPDTSARSRRGPLFLFSTIKRS